MKGSRVHGVCDSCARKIDWQAVTPYRSYMDEFAFHLGGKHFVLVDDVITTGSTADACARTLQEGGAGWATLLCFAASAGIKSTESEGENDDLTRNLSEFIV